MEKVAARYKGYPETKLYPFVYISEYNGSQHIFLFDMLSSNFFKGELFFTLDGRRIPEFDPGTGKPIDEDLWFEIESAMSETGTLFWTQSMYSRSKSLATRIEGGTPITIKTPNGRIVPDVYTRRNDVDETGILEELAREYPNAEILLPASSSYNCHGYAWHMKSALGGFEVWINDQPEQYIEDGSYQIVPAGTPNAKVWYNSDDHSAIAETATMFVSKWGKWPLLRHHKDDSSYDAFDVEYYRRINPASEITIVGPESVSINTVQRYDQSNATPNGVTFNGWTISPNTYSVTGGGGRSHYVQVKFTTTGTYTITANYTVYGTTPHSIYKTVVVTDPSIPPTPPTISSVTWRSMNYPNPATPGNYVTFTAAGNLAGATLEWTKGAGCDPYGGYAPNATSYMALVAQDSGQYINMTVRAKRNGVWSNTFYARAPVQLPYRAPAAKNDEEEETEEDEAAE